MRAFYGPWWEPVWERMKVTFRPNKNDSLNSLQKTGPIINENENWQEFNQSQLWAKQSRWKLSLKGQTSLLVMQIWPFLNSSRVNENIRRNERDSFPCVVCPETVFGNPICTDLISKIVEVCKLRLRLYGEKLSRIPETTLLQSLNFLFTPPYINYWGYSPYGRGKREFRDWTKTTLPWIVWITLGELTPVFIYI